MYKALIVDDDAAVLLTLKMLFQARHFEVAAAGSAQEASAKIEAEYFDLVVTDIRMETHTSGFDVVRNAKNRAHSPIVVILSAYPVSPADWCKAGADAMFIKGGSPFAMIDQIERLLERHVRQRAAS